MSVADLFGGENKTPKRIALEALFKKALIEKPEITPGSLRKFVRRDYPFLSKTTTEDYAEGLMVLIDRYLEKKKTEKPKEEQKPVETVQN